MSFRETIQSRRPSLILAHYADIVCPDNDVTSAMDNARMEWSATDPAANRPALSRWSKEYKDEFAAFMEQKLAK